MPIGSSAEYFTWPPTPARLITPAADPWKRWWMYEQDFPVEPLYTKLCETGLLWQDDRRAIPEISEPQLLHILECQQPGFPRRRVQVLSP